MSIITKTLLAVAVSTTLAGAAYASDASDASPWVLKTDMAYTVDTTGHTMVVPIGTMKNDVMARAKAVPAGTIFFMQNGHLMMADINTR